LLINTYQAKNMINRANKAIKNGFYIKLDFVALIYILPINSVKLGGLPW
jgi:hypothetical protein